MNRGTRVGQAYVALTIDGSDLGKEVINEVEDVDYELVGKDAKGRFLKGFNSKKYTEANSEAIISKDRVEQAKSDMSSALANIGNAIKNDDHISQGILKQIEQEFNNGDLDALFKQVGDKAGVEMGSGLGRHVRQAVVDELYRLRSDAAKLDIPFSLSSERNGVTLPNSNFDSLVKEGERVVQSFTKDWEAAIKENVRRRIAAEREVDRQSRRISSGSRDTLRTGLSGTIGRLFGMQSRNNFLNLIGKTIGGAVQGVELLSTKLGGLSDWLGVVSKKAGPLEPLLSSLSTQFGSIAESVAAGAASGPVIAAAIAVVILVLSSLISAVSALIALAVALASTLAYSLSAAALGAGAALGATLTTAGLLVAAFMSLSAAQKTLINDALQPLKREFNGLGQVVMRGLLSTTNNFQTWSNNLAESMVPLANIAQRIGAAVGEAGNIFTKALSGPGVQQFIYTMGVYLPGIITNLAAASGSFVNAFGSIFSAAMPYLLQFSRYLASITQQFATWANSAQGKNAIADFAARAVVSLQSLWNFVTTFTDWLLTVLFNPSAQQLGNSIFDVLTATFQKFKAAASDGSLEKWFSDAAKFGGDLWALIVSLGDAFGALYSSGTLEALGEGIKGLADSITAVVAVLTPLIDVLGPALHAVMAASILPLQAVAAAVTSIGDAISWVLGLVGIGSGTDWSRSANAWKGVGDLVNTMVMNGGSGSAGRGIGAGATGAASSVGARASAEVRAMLNQLGKSTDVNSGLWVNPYKSWAESLVKNGPSISAKIRNAMLSVNKQIASAIKTASSADTASAVKDNLSTLITNIKSSAESTVNTAQDALNSAAQSLASATSKQAANTALIAVRKAQKNLKAALDDQKKINAQAKILSAQKVVNSWNVSQLLDGVKVQNATLADYAAAREKLTAQLTAANQKLADAISLRDNYKTQVADSLKEFGSLLTAEAKTIDGVQQALTYGDITSNLQDRLNKIQAFQSKLQQLLALGLSNDAYKQLVDAGVDTGTTYADALLSGGVGAVNQVNSLVAGITKASDSLASEASNRLYQAGVSAAQGLVDGLTSLSKQLDAAATKLGNSIVKAIRKSLGINSPSKRLIGEMEYAGDGIVIGIDRQIPKVTSAASRLSSAISVSPEVATYAAQQRAAGVSGNSSDSANGMFRDLIVNTPTEDPVAVARETVNEIVGRI